MTSAPVAFFLWLEHGTRFATESAVGTLAGIWSQALFALAYAWLAQRFSWPLCLLGGTAVFAAATVALLWWKPPLLPAGLGAVAVLAACLLLAPRTPVARTPASPPPWDIPARMAVATLTVLLLTGLAARLGAALTGLLSPFPVFASVLAAFAQHRQGGAAGASVQRGLLAGLFAFVAFFAVLALLLEPAGALVGFIAATAAAIGVQAASLAVLRRQAWVFEPSGGLDGPAEP